MTVPDAAALFDALDRTWPAAATSKAGGFLIREGRGGGKRVSAATPLDGRGPSAIDEAEIAMRRLNQPSLFMIWGEDDDLDQALATRGYAIVDPVILRAAPLADLRGDLPRLTAFDLWEPLAIMIDIWESSGIDAARRHVMWRAPMPKTALLGRVDNRSAGVGFACCAGPIAMVHALEVRPAARRKGLARHMMHHAAAWAGRQGATHLAIAVTRDNVPANALYASLGMGVVGQYHYRMKTD